MKKLILIFLALSISLVACSSQSGSYDESQVSQEYITKSVNEPLFEEEIYQPDVESLEESPGENIGPANNRILISTHNINGDTQDYDMVLDKVHSLVNDYGGYSLTTNESSTRARSTYLSLRIPADKADDFVEDVKAIEGLNIISAQKEGTDVTDSYYDTQTRLSSLRSKLERLEVLRNEQGSLDDLLRVESEINSTIMEIEQMQARLNRFDQEISYTEINLNIEEVTTNIDQISTTKPSFASRLKSALSSSWHGAISLVQEIILFIIVALPIVVILGLIGYGIYRLVKFLRKKSNKNNRQARFGRFFKRKNKEDHANDQASQEKENEDDSYKI